jgi:hypothetical protein
MNPNKPFRRLGVSFVVLSAALFFARIDCAGSSAQQQEQQQSQPPPPPASSSTSAPSSQPAPDPATSIGPLPVKRRKVWTNDDVEVLRTPTDNYLAEKEAKAAADAKAAAKEAAVRAALKSEKESPLDIELPATPEETERALQTARDDVQEETTILGKLHRELLESPAEQQAEKQKEIDLLTGKIDTLQRDVKALQRHLETLRAKSREQNPPAPPQPPPTAGS